MLDRMYDLTGNNLHLTQVGDLAAEEKAKPPEGTNTDSTTNDLEVTDGEDESDATSAASSEDEQHANISPVEAKETPAEATSSLRCVTCKEKVTRPCWTCVDCEGTSRLRLFSIPILIHRRHVPL